MDGCSDHIDKMLRTIEQLGETFGKNLPVVIDFCPGTRQAVATLKLIDVGEHSAAFPVSSCRGEPLQVAFNPRFLRCALTFAGNTLQLTDGVKPAVFIGGGEGRYALLMPVRLT